MVLVLDDMCNGARRSSVRGICIEMIERMAARRPGRVSAASRWGASPSGDAAANGRAGACSTSTRSTKPQPIVLRRRVRSRRLEARLATRWSPRPASTLRLHSLVLAARSSRTARIKGVICETKAGREAILGERGDRRHRRPRRRGVGRRAVHRWRLHRHHGVPPRRRRHRRGRALRARGAGGLRGARPRGQAHHGRLAGSTGG